MSSRLRVAVVHDLIDGGAHRRLREQVARLGDDLSVIEVCLGTAEPVTSEPRVVAFQPRAPTVRRWLRPPLRYVDLGLLVLAWRRAASEVQRLEPDVMFANPCRYLQAPLALLWTRVPSLYFTDEPRRVDHDPGGSRRNVWTRIPYAALYAGERWLDRQATRAATRLVTNSVYTQGRIEQAYDKTSHVVPLGVPDRFSVGGAPREGHILSVGTLIPSKGHDLVLEGVARSEQRHRTVVVVSPRPNDAEARRLREIADRLGVQLEIRCAISDDELLGLYRGAHALLYLAIAEPLGLASLEAQACGCPVVVADEGGLPETVVAGSGVSVQRTPEAVAGALSRLADVEVRSSMSQVAAAHGATYTWESSAEAVRRHLEDLVRR